MTMDTVETAKVQTIRECGHDDTGCETGFSMIPPTRSRRLAGSYKGKELSRRTSGSLLKNPEDDSMFEVELQLGATDESHIIRTIEYWET
jgi:hypothetical protein